MEEGVGTLVMCVSNWLCTTEYGLSIYMDSSLVRFWLFSAWVQLLYQASVNL